MSDDLNGAIDDLEKAETKIERIDGIIRQWQVPSYLRLHAGEMSAQEVRTVRAVLESIRSQIGSIEQFKS